MQAPVLLGVGVRLVAGVDDRAAAGGRRRHALPDVLGALAQAERRGLGRLQHLARAADELAGDQERQQHVGDPGELAGPHDQIVLVAAVGVACRVGVVLEQVDVPADALVGQPLLGVDQQVFQYPLTRAVVGDELHEAVALGGRILGVAADVEIQPRAVAQEDVRASAPRHHTPKQVTRDLVGTQPAMPMKGAGHTEFRLDAHDPPLHLIELTGWFGLAAHQPRRKASGSVAGRQAPTTRRACG